MQITSPRNKTIMRGRVFVQNMQPGMHNKLNKVGLQKDQNSKSTNLCVAAKKSRDKTSVRGL